MDDSLLAEYLRARAQKILQSLPDALPNDGVDHKNLQQLILGTLPEELSLEAVQIVAVISIAPSRGSSIGIDVSQRLAWACFSNVKRLKEIETEVIPAFGVSFRAAAPEAAYRTAFCLYGLLSVVPPRVLDLFAQSTELIVSLARCYDGPLSSTSLPNPHVTNTKVLILDCLHILFTHHINKTSNVAMGHLFALLHAIVELPSAPSTSSTFIPFLNRSMLGDYEATWQLSDEISKRAVESSLTRGVEYLTSALRMRKGNVAHIADPNAALSVLAHQPRLRTIPVTQEAAGDPKGKGRMRLEPSQSASGIDGLAVSRVLDIFPDENRAFVERCLVHPAFSAPDGAEKLIDMLLEGPALPDGLANYRYSGSDKLAVPNAAAVNISSSGRREHADSLLESRKNIFDNVPMDFSKLRIGKKQDAVGASIEDSNASSKEKHDLKAAILRRAREQIEAEMEEEAEAGVRSKKQLYNVAFEEELSDGDLASVTGVQKTFLSVAGGEDGSEDTDAEMEHEPMATTSTPVERTETLLELAYIKDPRVFDRDSETRRSKARAALKAETGWGDEQIEGWRIMLERNPRQKEKMLERHEFSGNVPLLVGGEGVGGSEPRADSRRGRGSHRGSGRRGGGNQGEGNTARDRARKDRSGNQQRRRGHDKKMARNAAPVA